MNFRVPFVLRDESLGYPVWRWIKKIGGERQWLQWFDKLLEEYKPDVVMGQNNPGCFLLRRAHAKGYSCFFFIRSLTCFEKGLTLSEGIHPIANSPLAATASAHYLGEEAPVVLPFINIKKYLVEKRERKYITFINPIPQKGVDVAFDIAKQLPERNFLFVKGKWSTYKQHQIDEFVAPAAALPNVDVWEYQSDMSQVYGSTDILLMPSQFTETFGRVIVEAQANGIPVVAARVGGIPFTIGKGGLLADPKDCAQPYLRAIRTLMDRSYYEEVSTLAYQNSQRPEFDAKQQVENFVQAIDQHAMATMK